METAAFTSGATQAQAQLRNLSGAAQSMAHGFSGSANSARIVSLELAHVTRSLGEQLAMGVSPARAFASEIGRIATAAQYAGGVGGLGRMIASVVAPFSAAAAGAGLLAAAFLGVKQAADSTDMKAYIDTLGLTDAQIKKLTDTTVTWGDVTKATFQILAEQAGTSSNAISSSFSAAFKGIGDFGKFAVSILVGGFAALVRGAASAANDVGLALGKGIAFGVNTGLDFLQKLINGVVSTANSVSGFFKSVGVDFGTLNTVDLSRFHVTVQGSFTNPLKDAQAQLHATFNAMEGGFDAISARAVKLRENNLAAQAAALREGDAAGKSAGGHEKAARAVKHHTDELKKLHDTLAEVSDELMKTSPLSGGDQASAIVGSGVDKAISAFDAQIAEEQKHQQQILQFADQFGAAIAGAVTGTESLKQAFGDMAKSILSQIIQMSVRMLIFKAIAGIFKMPDVGAASAGGGSSNYGYSGSGWANGGGGVFGGFGGVDNNLLSLNGSPIARVSKGENFRVTPAAAANDSGRVVIELRDEMLNARIAQGARVQIVQTAPLMQAGVQAKINDGRRRR